MSARGMVAMVRPERLHAAVVDEDDASALLEEVAAGMWIGVQQPASEHALEGEAPQGLGPSSAARFGRRAGFFEAQAPGELGREHAPTAEAREHPGHRDARI